ncbi:hypothetical protein NKG05_06160 [Oerskovia sp. M15]
MVRDGKAIEVDVTLAAKPTETGTDSGQPGSQDQGGSGQERPGSGQGESDPTDPNNVPSPFDWFNGQG